MNICKIDDCLKTSVNRGWCSRHYMKWYRHGDPMWTRKAKYRSPTHVTWYSMIRRCDSPNVKEYRNYGARGISYDPEWADFNKFLRDMGERPSGMTLDRINVNGNYTRNNCRWADKKTQSNNRRNNIYITYRGETKTRAEWNRIAGLPAEVLAWRLNNGWSMDRAMTTPLRVKKNNRPSS